MSHYAVHVPVDRDPRFFKKHLDRGLSAKEAAYVSLIEGVDKSLGDLLDWVDENGCADNTIIIFMSDNGGLAASSEWRVGNFILRMPRCVQEKARCWRVAYVNL